MRDFLTRTLCRDCSAAQRLSGRRPIKTAIDLLTPHHAFTFSGGGGGDCYLCYCHFVFTSSLFKFTIGSPPPELAVPPSPRDFSTLESVLAADLVSAIGVRLGRVHRRLRPYPIHTGSFQNSRNASCITHG